MVSAPGVSSVFRSPTLPRVAAFTARSFMPRSMASSTPRRIASTSASSSADDGGGEQCGDEPHGTEERAGRGEQLHVTATETAKREEGERQGQGQADPGETTAERAPTRRQPQQQSGQ